MENEFAPDLITLVDEDNKEHNFEILGEIEDERGKFYALYPVFDNAEDAVNDSGEYYIMEVIEEDGEEQLATLEDEALADELAAVFEENFEKLFDDDETEE
ncbi:MAG: DUF1292 domain-containing protein [Ruminococcus sp.]|nr:DUF1292 domain-containing protein [Ruminococcus sp.]